MSEGGGVMLLYLLIGTIANIPLGYMRIGQKSLTFGWFCYFLLSLPVILFLQEKAPRGTGFLVLVMMSVVTGQLAGGLIKALIKRKSEDNDYGV